MASSEDPRRHYDRRGSSPNESEANELMARRMAVTAARESVAYWTRVVAETAPRHSLYARRVEELASARRRLMRAEARLSALAS